MTLTLSSPSVAPRLAAVVAPTTAREISPAARADAANARAVVQSTPPSAALRAVAQGSETGRAAALAAARAAATAAASGRKASQGGGVELTEEERAAVAELRARDREVRLHEQAHAQVGGEFAGAPSYTYQVGPDGQRYAIGGEVPIDVTPIEGDPEATVEKMEVVKAAALAPAEPSEADRRVAAVADQQRAKAQADLTEIRAAERRGEEPEAAAVGAGDAVLAALRTEAAIGGYSRARAAIA